MELSFSSFPEMEKERLGSFFALKTVPGQLLLFCLVPLG
jgi:hypothetical protein